MNDTMAWAPLMAELDRWQAAGRIADLWLRDDDAVEPTLALDRLLALTGEHDVPLTLAVIPEDTGAALAACLDRAPWAEVAVHGWSHHNHAPATEKKQELGAHRPVDIVLGELGAGFDKLAALHKPRFVPMLVPPWNRIGTAVVSGLPDLGFKALSVFGAEKSGPLHLLNTHVDLMDWHGTRGGRDHGVLATELAARLKLVFEQGGATGFLTHHLVHDEQAWLFLETLLALTKNHAGCRWRTAAALIL